jgi:hypothetical protein
VLGVSAVANLAVLTSRLALVALLVSSVFSVADALPAMGSANETMTAAQQEREELRVFLKQAISDAGSFKDRFDAEVWLFDMFGRMAQYIKAPQE